MHEREMKYTGESQKLLSEDSHPETDSLGENRRNSANKSEKSMLKPNQIQ